MPTIEKRLTSVESAIDAILELNTHVVQSLANHETQISELKKQTAAMENRAAAMEKRAEAMEKRAAAMEKRAGATEQSLESVKRFDRQTRKLWIMIARKVDWLDEDDIDRWETEDL